MRQWILLISAPLLVISLTSHLEIKWQENSNAIMYWDKATSLLNEVGPLGIFIGVGILLILVEVRKENLHRKKQAEQALKDSDISHLLPDWQSRPHLSKTARMGQKRRRDIESELRNQLKQLNHNDNKQGLQGYLD